MSHKELPGQQRRELFSGGKGETESERAYRLGLKVNGDYCMASAEQFVNNEHLFFELKALNSDAWQFGVRKEIALDDVELTGTQKSLNLTMRVRLETLDENIKEKL